MIVFVEEEFGFGAFEIVARYHFLERLVDGVIHLRQIDLGDDVESIVRHGSMTQCYQDAPGPGGYSHTFSLSGVKAEGNDEAQDGACHTGDGRHERRGGAGRPECRAESRAEGNRVRGKRRERLESSAVSGQSTPCRNVCRSGRSDRLPHGRASGVSITTGTGHRCPLGSQNAQNLPAKWRGLRLPLRGSPYHGVV